jgi:hypothetical protein
MSSGGGHQVQHLGARLLETIRLGRDRWRSYSSEARLGLSLAAIGVIVSAACGAIQILQNVDEPEQVTPSKAEQEKLAEEALVGQIKAGMPYQTMIDILGRGPDQIQRTGDDKVALWDRPWEFIVATIDASANAVVVGLFATDPSFHPAKFSGWNPEFGKPVSVYDRGNFTADSSDLVCGARSSTYLEFRAPSGATDFRSIVVGAVNLSARYKVASPCTLVMDVGPCDGIIPYDCMDKLRSGGRLDVFRNKLPISAIVIMDSSGEREFGIDAVQLPW